MNPSKVNILGLTYDIEEVPVVNKEIPRAGEINFITQKIRIDETLTEERKRIVFWHEVIHGICDQFKFDIGDDEQVVQGLAVAIAQILIDNGGK